MRNAVILDYTDGTIDILPIPSEISADKEEDFVMMHPAYDSDSCHYMIVDGDIEIFKVMSDTPTYLPIATIDDSMLNN